MGDWNRTGCSDVMLLFLPEMSIVLILIPQVINRDHHFYNKFYIYFQVVFAQNYKMNYHLSCRCKLKKSPFMLLTPSTIISHSHCPHLKVFTNKFCLPIRLNCRIDTFTRAIFDKFSFKALWRGQDLHILWFNFTCTKSLLYNGRALERGKNETMLEL